ncbi:MAG: hypothetical protein J6T38_08930 [Bacteroidaceae bacterium]|nr:hypothetical protein [Bacteroidaceae bacterium]
MNVKFKMPKFEHDLKGKGWLKELLMTTLATTISIVLTFGTAAILERKQQEDNRRQITLMVISDIYDFARVMERTDTALLIPWKESLLEMKAMPRDSLIMLDDEEVLQNYWNALGQGAMLPRDHTAQNLFSSDISIWRDVDNYNFVKFVGKCYYLIEATNNNFDTEIRTKTDNYKLFLKDADQIPDSLQLVTFLEMPEVKSFIDEYSQNFIPYFEETIKDLDYAVEHSCEMMGISQDELKEFMKKNSQ